MRKLLITFLLLFLIKPFFAQKDSAHFFLKKSIYLEFLGNSPTTFYSFNYEHYIFSIKKNHLVIRLGLSYLWGSFKIYNAPILLNYVMGEKNNHFEMGAGIAIEHDTRTISRQPQTYVFPTFSIGYRYQKPTGKFIFRAGFTPTINPETYNFANIIYFLRVGTSFGYNF